MALLVPEFPSWKDVNFCTVFPLIFLMEGTRNKGVCKKIFACRRQTITGFPMPYLSPDLNSCSFLVPETLAKTTMLLDVPACSHNSLARTDVSGTLDQAKGKNRQSCIRRSVLSFSRRLRKESKNDHGVGWRNAAAATAFSQRGSRGSH